MYLLLFCKVMSCHFRDVRLSSIPRAPMRRCHWNKCHSHWFEGVLEGDWQIAGFTWNEALDFKPGAPFAI